MPEAFKQTDIGLIPEDWELKTLEDVTDKLKAGGTPRTTEESYWNGDIPLVKVEDVVNTSKYLTTTNLYITIDGLNNSSAYLLPENSLLFTMYGTAGEVAINTIPVAPTQNVLGIIHNSEIDSNFLYYALKFSKSGTLERIVDRTIFKHFTLAKAKRLLLTVPPLPEQKKIAHILSKIQLAIETQEKIIKTTQELKKALMQKLFTEGINGEPQKQTEIGLIPESWEVVELGKYAKILNGFAFKSKDYVKKGLPLIRISNVSFGYLISKDDKYLPESYIERYSDYALNEGDLILSLTRPVTSGGMKYCFIEKKHLPALLNQRVGRFKIIDNCLSKEFLYHTVFSKYFIGELEKLFGSSSQQPNVSPSQLESFKIPLPPKPIQTEITNSLNSVYSKILNSEQLIISLKSLFISLLNNLMTGQIRVKDIEFEIEESLEEIEA